MENKKEMNDNERCQNLIALQNSRLERFDNSRKIQWNFNGIFWTGMIVSISFFIKENRGFHIGDLLIVAPLLLLIHAATIYLIQQSLGYDKSAVDRYREPAESLLGLTPETSEALKDRKWEWFWIQIGVSILILACAIIILKK